MKSYAREAHVETCCSYPVTGTAPTSPPGLLAMLFPLRLMHRFDQCSQSAVLVVCVVEIHRQIRRKK